MLDGLIKWLNVGPATVALKATRDQDSWKVMITHPKEQGP